MNLVYKQIREDITYETWDITISKTSSFERIFTTFKLQHTYNIIDDLLFSFVGTMVQVDRLL